MIFIFWILLAVLVGIVASKKGSSGLGYFVLSVLFSPLISLLVLLILSSNAASSEKKGLKSGTLRKCPSCAEAVKAEAKICKHCSSELPEIELPAQTGSRDYISDFVNGKLSFPVTFWGFGVCGSLLIGYLTLLISSALQAGIFFTSFASLAYRIIATIAVWRSRKSFKGNNALLYGALGIMSLLVIANVATLISHMVRFV